MKKYPVCVVGTGYVGLVTGACLAALGHRVVCVDSDKKKIAALKGGRIPIYEPGLPELFRKVRRAGRLHFAASVSEGMRHGGHRAEIVFIAVGTPPRPDGSADLTAIESVSEEIARNLRDYTIVVEKSTVPVETCAWVSSTIERWNKGRIPYDVASNPEFLSEGTAVEDFMKPDRVVLGVSSKRAETALRELYAPLEAPILVTDPKSAEIIKHASNSFLATKISFINAVAALCERVGADVTQVARGMGLDRRIGAHFLNAGIGFGGFCFPKDLEAFYWISKSKGYDFSLLKAVSEINDRQKAWIPGKAAERLWNLDGKTVALLGLSFKPGTDDLRFAPSRDVAAALLARGARVSAYDPVSMAKARAVPEFRGVRFAKNPYECVRGADALALVTEWPQFSKLDWRRIFKLMRNPLVLDGRDFLDPKALKDLGFSYAGVGRGNEKG